MHMDHPDFRNASDWVHKGFRLQDLRPRFQALGFKGLNPNHKNPNPQTLHPILQEKVKKEMRLYKCWASAREVELEVDEIGFSYEREGLIDSSADTGATPEESNEGSNKTKKEVRAVKAKSTESLAKAAPGLILIRCPGLVCLCA